VTDPLAATEATWPPATTWAIGAVTLREGAGGGQRVSAATAGPGWTEGDLDAAIATMADPLFRVSGDPALDASLARRGLVVHDPVVVMLARDISLLPAPDRPVARVWPPEAAADLWAAEGITSGRLAVMHRAPEPKAVLAIGGIAAAFVACHGGWVVLHALVVARGHRRQGAGRAVTLEAAAFGRDHGATGMALLVTAANGPARGLYAALGLSDAGQYHYRRLPRAISP
jgi:ribosomal protein S18 acetylase RimI-like enzyme